ncbi:MAG: hypothetical protein Q8Q60_00345 [Candidatus Chromulinivorax sp.]|nr:hypothetical protein [Candidatus Chromulinivorax sp.]
MLQMILQVTTHIVPFMGVMGQVVTIWGFLNFMNQLNLQNLTLVADRALGRLPGLKNQIFILKNYTEQDSDKIAITLDTINEIVKRLYMDLKQLGIAKNYDMLTRINLLSQQNDDMYKVKTTYLNYELGSDQSIVYKMSSAMKISFVQKLENQLLNIFDLSRQGQTFINHLSTNVIRISWFSLVIYLVECQYLTAAVYLLSLGIFTMLFSYWYNEFGA